MMDENADAMVMVMMTMMMNLLLLLLLLLLVPSLLPAQNKSAACTCEHKPNGALRLKNTTCMNHVLLLLLLMKMIV